MVQCGTIGLDWIGLKISLDANHIESNLNLDFAPHPRTKCCRVTPLVMRHGLVRD